MAMFFATPLPACSIIVPVYNSAATLSLCLNSVLSQTEHNIEILCINDGSTDTSRAILDAYAQKDTRVRVIHHPCNMGVSAARNTGIQAATGEFMAFVDSDDTLAPNFCQKLYAAATANGADIAKGNYAYTQHDHIDFSINQAIREDKKAFFIQFCAAIYRTAFLKKHNILFDPRLHASEDLVFAFTAAQHANAIAIDDAAHIVINTRHGSVTFAPPHYKTVLSHYRAFSSIIAMAKQSAITDKAYNHVLASLFSLMLRMAARNRQPKVRAFVAAKNRQLYLTALNSSKWNANFFAQSLPSDDVSIALCLSNNTVQEFFVMLDKMQMQRCRMLRRHA